MKTLNHNVRGGPVKARAECWRAKHDLDSVPSEASKQEAQTETVTMMASNKQVGLWLAAVSGTP